MAFEINSATPTPSTAMPPIGNKSGIIQFPKAEAKLRGDGHSITVGKPWLELHWDKIPVAGANYWFGLFAADTTMTATLSAVQAWNPRTGGYTTYSSGGICHRPTWQGVLFKGSTPAYYVGFHVLITGLS